MRASDVKRGIDRSLRAEHAAFGLLGPIESVEADDRSRTVVIRLERPDPDLLYRLALPFAAAVPPEVPKPPGIVPATGPYRIAEHDRQHMRLERNPHFRVWSPLARPDGYPDVIEAAFGVSAREAVTAIRTGRSDYAWVDRFGENMADVRERDPGLLREASFLQSSWVFLNTRVPPFDRVDARRAVSLAIDRPAAVAAFGGPYAARETCRILPPTLAGYRPGCPKRDLREARRLVRRSGTRGARVTLWNAEPLFSSLTPVIIDALRAIGYRTRVRDVPMDRYFRLVEKDANRVQIGPTAWIADYPSDASFLTASFSCDAMPSDPARGANYSRFCDRGVDALLRRAGAAQTSDPATADELWARAEQRVLDAAAAVPLFNPITTEVVSARVRNDQRNPQWGFLPDQAWVR